jgi:hypothetical protein
MSEALYHEIRPFGIKLTLVERGAFRTDWAGSSMVRTEPTSAYNVVLAGARERFAEANLGHEPGNPARAAQVLLELVADPDPPLRLLLGNAAYDLTTGAYQTRLSTWAAREDLTRSVDVSGAGV